MALWVLAFSNSPLTKHNIDRALRFSHMDKSNECCSTHVIDGDGVFNVAELENFMREVKLAECGLSYAVVSLWAHKVVGRVHYQIIFSLPTSERWMHTREGHKPLKVLECSMCWDGALHPCYEFRGHWWKRAVWL